MKKVFICSRYRPDEKHTRNENIHRAIFACTIALNKGYAPIAPHLYLPRCLDDGDVEERELGLEAGMAWLAVCDELWQWGATVSEGMAVEIAHAHDLGIPVKVFNSIGIPREQWNHEIKFISYDGKYPNLCCGVLTFSIDGKVRKTNGRALRSGGNVHFSSNWNEHVGTGDWELCDATLEFSDLNKRDLEFLTAEVNEHVEHGCCGGCV